MCTESSNALNAERGERFRRLAKTLFLALRAWWYLRVARLSRLPVGTIAEVNAQMMAKTRLSFNRGSLWYVRRVPSQNAAAQIDLVFEVNA